MKMADLILANSEKIAKFAKINSLQNYPLYVTSPSSGKHMQCISYCNYSHEAKNFTLQTLLSWHASYLFQLCHIFHVGKSLDTTDLADIISALKKSNFDSSKWDDLCLSIGLYDNDNKYNTI